MKTKTIILVLVAAFTISLIGCGGGGGGKTPKEAISGMMDAAKAKDWEKAVSYMDIDGICKQMKKQMDEQTKDMSEEEKKEFEEALPAEMKDMMDPKKFKETIIKQMKEDKDKQDFEYEITDVSDEEDGVVTVTVKLTPKDGESDEQKIPVKKVGGVWKVSIPGMD